MDIFYNVLKDSDEDKLQLLSKEIYKMNRYNEDYWKFIIQNSILEDNIILLNLNNLNLVLLISKQKLNDSILLNEDFLFIINEKKLYHQVIKDQNLNITILEFYIEKFDDIKWQDICKYQNLTIEFMEKNINNIDWEIISESQFMTLEFIIKYKDKISWNLIGQNIKLEYLFNDTFVDLFSDNNIWDILIWSNNISKDYLINNINKLTYKQILELLEYKKLEEDIINIILKKYNNNLDLYKIITENQDLSKEFIQNNISKLDIDIILENQKVDLDFIQANVENINKLSYNDNLSENLLLDIYKIKNQFKDELDWDYISEYCDLTHKSLSEISELNKSLLLDNNNIKL
jgi:hypothetical protein